MSRSASRIVSSSSTSWAVSALARRASSSICRLSIDAAACSAIISASTCMLSTAPSYFS